MLSNVTAFHLQVLGPITSIAPATPDDEKTEISNKKKGALYLVNKALKLSYYVIIFGL